jgi:hypothetical protein
VGVLAAKLFLAPSFVVGASVATRRFGASIGGVLAGLPVVAGPILLVYALQHGRAFASHAAGGTLLGLLSLSAFVLVYGHLARRTAWAACVLAGWSAFLAGTFALDHLTVPPGGSLALVLAGLALGAVILPRPFDRARASFAEPSWDLLLRACCALALVLALTALSGRLGAHLSGLLAPFPIITAVLAAFTHAQSGPGEALRLLRGMLGGFVAFALFCFTLTIALRSLDIALSFTLATSAAIAAQTVAFALTQRGAAHPLPQVEGS